MQENLAIPGFEPPTRVVPRGAWTKRQYQLDAFAATFEKLKTHNSTLLVMATGTGKTRTAAEIIAEWLRKHLGPVLWLAHLDTLIEQTRGELMSLVGEYVGLEQGPSRWERERVCVASLATLYRKERLEYVRRRPTLVIYDEAHHAPSASNKRILDAMPGAKKVFLTATPGRFDGIGLKTVCQSVAIEYPINVAIQDGYLVPVEMEVATIAGLEFGHLKKRELTDENLAKVVGRDDVLKGIVTATLERIGERRCAMFFPTVHVAHLAADVFNSIKPGIAVAIDGTKMDRDEKKSRIKAFKKSDYQIVCNVGVLAEGYDDPGISAIGLGAPSNSINKILQQLGRGTRNVCNVDAFESAEERRFAIAASAKPNLLVIDFVGNSNKHNLVTAIDCLAGDDIDEETLAKAKKIAKTARMSAEDAIEKAKSEIASERKREAERVASATAVTFSFAKFNPFEAFGMPLPNRQDGHVQDALNRSSPEQVSQLVRSGVKNAADLSGEEAQRLIRTMNMRRAKGLANFKQIRLLAKYGIKGGQMYFHTASAIIGYMKDFAARNGRSEWNLQHPGESVIKEIIRRGREVGSEG